MTYARRQHWTALRGILAAMLAVLLFPAVYVTPKAAGLGVGASILTASAATFALLALLSRLLPDKFATAQPNGRWLLGCWVLASLYAGYELTRLSFYIGDIDQVEYAVDPPSRPFDDPQLAKPFFVKHCCFTCYTIGAYLASTGADNLYDSSQYRDAKKETPIHKTIGNKLHIDRYQYPPPFLLLPGALLATGADFFQVRAFWHTLNVTCFLITSVWLAGWLSKGRFGVFWLMIPAVLAAPTTLTTLQVGNAHFLVIGLSVLAMLAFENNRFALGGGLLGYTIVSKLFPGVLLVYLLARRRWRAALWTIGAMVTYAAVTLAAYGEAPYKAFVTYQLPRLLSGEAFSFAWKYLRAIMVNSSVMGAVYKLGELGVLPEDRTATIAKIAVWIFSVLLLLIAATVGWKHAQSAPCQPGGVQDSSDRRLTLALAWFVLLILGQLRSPFLPWGYGNVVILWFTALLLYYGSRNGRIHAGRIALTIAIGLGLAITVPLPFGPPSGSFDLVYTLVLFAIVIVACTAVMLREIFRPPSLTEQAPVHAQ